MQNPANAATELYKPISLYFDIEKGQHADLEVVAKAAIEWVTIIRQLGEIVAPGVEFDIELVETEDGSLWLSNLLKALKEGDRKAIGAIIWAVLIFFAMGPVLHVQADAGDKFWEALGHKAFDDLSDETKNDIAKKVVEAMQKTSVGESRQRMIHEVGKDPRIKGVGVDRSPKTGGPFVIINRDDFPSYATDTTPKRPLPIKDTNYRNSVRVKIARANLEEGEAGRLEKLSDFGE